jgi:hypothetical protein
MTPLDALIYRRRLYYLKRRLLSARPLEPWEKGELVHELSKLIAQNRPETYAACRIKSRETLSQE